MSEKTTGPWVAEDLDANFIAINDAEGNWVGEAYSKANARLMIAAPDLLEALEAALLLVDMSTSIRRKDIAEQSRDAIAKAKGEHR